jgi:outer membrane receptor protein involved in Fe transport
MNYRFTLAGLLVALLLFSAPVAAQTFGEITGSVTDSSGAVVAGATVNVANSATGVERKVTTNEVGNYNVPFLNPGRYNLTAQLEGFKIASRSGIIVQVGDVVRANFTMEVGAVTETIEVTGGAPLLQTESTALGTVIDQQRIVDLPLNGRNFLQLVRLSSNVSAEMGSGGQANSRQGGERANQAISISGQRQQYNQFTLDGVENTDPNFNTFVVRPSVDALQEFKVQTGVYSAEFGKATSQINATTRSGSNDIHGSVFEFLRNDAIQATPWLTSAKSPFRRNQYGFTVGGPIIKNRLFFLGNYEGLRDRTSREAHATTATVGMRNGDFSGTGDFRTIYDPDTIKLLPNGTYTSTPFDNNVIPKARFKQPFLKLLDYYPEPNVPGAIVGKADWNFIRSAPSPTDYDQITTRIDFAESASSQWFGRLSWGDESVLNGSTLGFNDSGVATNVWQIMLSNTRTLSAATVNELRLGANLFDNDLLTSQFNGVTDISGSLGIPGLNTPAQAAWGAPQVGFGGFTSNISGWGESTEGPFINRNRTYQILDNVSWVHSNHTIKFGAEVADRRYNQIGNQFPRGNLIFAGRYTALPTDINGTGHGFASGLLGWTSEATRALGIANLQFRQKAYYFYAEDSWKITPTLTLNLGVRYENVPPWKDRYRGILNVKMPCNGLDNTGIDESCAMPTLVRTGEGDFHEGLAVHFGDIVPKAAGDDVLYSHALIRRDNNDWAPRIGLAWQLTPRMTLRTGYGIYYGQDTGNPVFDMGRNLGFRDSAFSADAVPISNLDAPWANKAGGAVQCSNWDGPCVAGLYTFRNDPERRTPYVQQFMLNFQRQLSDTMVFEVGYAGNLGHKLQRMYGFNEAIQKAGPLDSSTLDQRRPFGGKAFGIIQTIGGGVSSNYNALAVKIQQRFSKGLTYLVGYTWSHAIDSGSAIRTNDGDNLFPAYSYDFKAERGPSQFDTRQRLTASILYELPLKFQQPVLEALAGGWQIGSILTLSNGTPFGGGTCGDTNSTGEGNRGDATGVSLFPDNPTADQFFTRDPSDNRGPAGISCTVPDGNGFNALTYREGNVTRNPYIAPGVINWDFALSKAFRVTEGIHVEFRFESFNFANHPQWNQPDTGVTSLTYGRVSSARTMRTNQFALKVVF